MTVSSMLLALCFLMSTIAWLFFRLPNIPFWSFAPIERANQYLRPFGVALWIGGMCIGVAGLMMGFIGYFQ